MEESASSAAITRLGVPAVRSVVERACANVQGGCREKTTRSGAELALKVICLFLPVVAGMCSRCFQPRKGGDMACVRGPLGAFCFICNIVFFNLGSAC
jgi:hypothetical protein